MRWAFTMTSTSSLSILANWLLSTLFKRSFKLKTLWLQNCLQSSFAQLVWRVVYMNRPFQAPVIFLFVLLSWSDIISKSIAFQAPIIVLPWWRFLFGSEAIKLRLIITSLFVIIVYSISEMVKYVVFYFNNYFEIKKIKLTCHCALLVLVYNYCYYYCYCRNGSFLHHDLPIDHRKN